MIPSQTETIRFALLFEHLNEEEQSVFLQSLVSQHQSIIVTALRYWIIKQPFIGKQLNSTLSNIIESRTENEVTKQLSLSSFDLLPQVVIANCALFLEQNDYGKLSQTNRAVYMACNDPNVLRHMDLRLWNNQFLIAFPVCESVRLLECNVDKNNQKLLNKHRFRNVETLRLYIMEDECFEMQLSSFDCTTICELSIWSCEIKFEYSNLNNVLCKFENLKHFAFIMNMNRSSINDEEIPTSLLHLEGISIFKTFAYFPKLLEKCALQWKYLSFEQSAVSDVNFSCYKFSQLSELRVSNVCEKAFLDVIKTVKNLTKVFLNGSVESKMSKNTIQKLFESCIDLEYIGCENYHATQVVNIVRGIQLALLNTLSTKRKNFILYLYFYCSDFRIDEEWDNFLKLINEVAVLLEDCTDNFMIVYEDEAFIPKYFEDKLKRTVPKCVDMFVIESDSAKEKLLIFNKNCIISGFHPKWFFDSDTIYIHD